MGVGGTNKRKRKFTSQNGKIGSTPPERELASNYKGGENEKEGKPL